MSFIRPLLLGFGLGFLGIEIAFAQVGPLVDWSAIGVRAGGKRAGEALAVSPMAPGNARLRCAFQRLEAEATPDGLWLATVVPGQPHERFRVMAIAIGRGDPLGPVTEPRNDALTASVGIGPSFLENHGRRQTLSAAGTVIVGEKHVRFDRPGLREEYSATLEGIRQDFLVEQAPQGSDPLRIELTVTGAQAETTTTEVRLVLRESRRQLAYGRLQVTDAYACVLPAYFEAASAHELAVVVDDSQATYPLRIDPTFSDANWVAVGSLPGANGRVLAAAADGEGSVYIGGEFRVVGDIVANHVAKWDGTRWFALGEGVNDAVRALAISGHDLYVGGDFSMAGDAAAGYVAQWNGSRWSVLGGGIAPAGGRFGSHVYALAWHHGDLYAGGIFTTAGGAPARNIARWKGNEWSALGSGIEGGTPFAEASVRAMAVYDGSLYAGGFFADAGGMTVNNIARWDGTRWSALGVGMGDAVGALVASDTRLYAGGNFLRAGAVSAYFIAEWDGHKWSALGDRIQHSVAALAVMGNELFAGYAPNSVAKWNGGEWSATGLEINGSVEALAVSGRDLFAGGGFTSLDRVPADFVARWNGDAWSALGSGMAEGIHNTYVYALARSGRDLYVAGNFTIAGGLTVNHVAKWDGETWSALGEGTDDDVYALAVFQGHLYAAGVFNRAGGLPAQHIARWNGKAWSPLGKGIDGGVSALAVAGDDLYVGGSFASADGVPANSIVKWDGRTWTALGDGIHGEILAVAVAGGQVYAAGRIQWPLNHIVRWDGRAWLPVGAGTDDTIYVLVASEEDLYAGGAFTRAGGVPARYIAKWNGNNWSPLGEEGPFNALDAAVRALAFAGKNLYVGGDFSSYNWRSSLNHIAGWDGNSWSALGSGLNNIVHALAASESELYAAGGFTIAGGKASAYIAKAVFGSSVRGINASADATTIPFAGVPGQPYDVQRTASLSRLSVWTTLNPSPVTPGADGQATFTDTDPPDDTAYYRISEH